MKTTDLMLPVQPRDFDLTLETFDVTNESPYGFVQREERPTVRWRAEITFPESTFGQDKRRLDAWIARAVRAHSLTLVQWPFEPEGTFDHEELIEEGAENWSAVDAVVTDSAGQLKVRNDSASEGYAVQDVELESGKVYALRAQLIRGRNEDFKIEVYDTVAGAVLTDSTQDEEGVLTLEVSPDNTGTHEVRLYTNVAQVDRFVYYDHVSLSRCFKVDDTGGGTFLGVEALPDPPLDDVLLMGDMVEIVDGPKSELKRLTNNIDSRTNQNGVGGKGDMTFEPELRNTPAQGALVIPRRPRVRMYFDGNGATTAYRPPNFGGFAVSMVEDVLAEGLTP